MSSASEALQEAAKGNLASGTKLSNALPKALPALKRFVDEEKYEDADEELKKWKRHTERLQEQIDNQLSHCRSLRENKTLLSLYSEDKGVVLARKSQEVLSFLKSDIRSLNHNFPKVAYQLTEENEYESKNDDAELDEAEKIFRDRRQAEGPSRREKVLRELNMLLEKADPTALPMEEKETPSVNLEGIFELLKLRGQMTSNVLFQAIKQKKELDRAFGYDEDFRKVRRHDFNESDEVFQMTSVLHNGKKMANELKSCRMALAPDAGETMHQLISDNATMTSKLKESEAALKKATALLEEFQSGKSLSTVERIKMQEALSKYETVHSTLRKEQEINAMNTATTNQLKDQVKVLNSRNERLKRNLAAKISWFDPQIQSVEMALKETKKSLDTVTMDVTLMSRMYQESLGELNRMSKKAKAVEEERDDMGAKMAELIKKIQIEKRENRRKDKIIDRVMAARIVRNRSIQEQGENMAETQKQLDVSIWSTSRPLFLSRNLSSNILWDSLTPFLSSSFACVCAVVAFLP
jgi:hypothetical protein